MHPTHPDSYQRYFLGLHPGFTPKLPGNTNEEHRSHIPPFGHRFFFFYLAQSFTTCQAIRAAQPGACSTNFHYAALTAIWAIDFLLNHLERRSQFSSCPNLEILGFPCTFKLLSHDLWRPDEGPYRDSCAYGTIFDDSTSIISDFLPLRHSASHCMFPRHVWTGFCPIYFSVSTAC